MNNLFENMRSSTEEEKKLYSDMLKRLGTPLVQIPYDVLYCSSLTDKDAVDYESSVALDLSRRIHR